MDLACKDLGFAAIAMVASSASPRAWDLTEQIFKRRASSTVAKPGQLRSLKLLEERCIRPPRTGLPAVWVVLTFARMNNEPRRGVRHETLRYSRTFVVGNPPTYGGRYFVFVKLITRRQC